MDTSDWIAASAAIIALIAFLFGLFGYIEGRRQQSLLALQGTKEAVAATASRISAGKLPYFATHRHELFESLCLAAVFERSGRSRALIYAALSASIADRRKTLRHGARGDMNRAEICQIIDEISAVVIKNWSYTDLTRARRMLSILRAALDLDGDVRTRVEKRDLLVPTALTNGYPDWRCKHSAHEWDSFKNALEKAGSLILVCATAAPPGADAIIALDYHRAARESVPDTRERLSLTELGELVVTAKYAKLGDQTAQDIVKFLADKLAAFVMNHPLYADAGAFAAVCGTHDFSQNLGYQIVQTLNEREDSKNLDFLRIEHSDNRTDVPRFRLGNHHSRLPDRVILFDDVYRTGSTWAKASRLLLGRGSTQVLGLVVTCSVSKFTNQCADEES